MSLISTRLDAYGPLISVLMMQMKNFTLPNRIIMARHEFPSKYFRSPNISSVNAERTELLLLTGYDMGPTVGNVWRLQKEKL